VFEAYAVERLLSDYSNCVFDFGAGHSVYDGSALFDCVERALVPFSYVVLLLLSPDVDTSIRILSDRNPVEDSDVISMNNHFLHHPSNTEFPTYTVYTKGKTLEVVGNEILGFMKR